MGGIVWMNYFMAKKLRRNERAEIIKQRFIWLKLRRQFWVSFVEQIKNSQKEKKILGRDYKIIYGSFFLFVDICNWHIITFFHHESIFG